MTNVDEKTRGVAAHYASEEAFVMEADKQAHAKKMMRFRVWARSIVEGRATLIDFSQRHVRTYVRIALKEIEELSKENEKLRGTRV